MLKNSNNIFRPKNISLKDDAFHKSSGVFHAEWWYFDAIFNDGYSVNGVVGIRCKDNYDAVLSTLCIYKHTKPIFRGREIKNFDEFSASEQLPHIKLSNKDVIIGKIEDKTGDWIYKIMLEIEDKKIDLEFTGLTRGWMGKIPCFGKWGAILPRAKVKGMIILDDKKIPVVGTGYHDHNWDFKFPMQFNGWHWGKFGGGSLNIVWLRVILTESKEYLVAVLNDGKTNYLNIKPENIQFLANSYAYDDNGKKIPTVFILKIDDEDKLVHVDATMKTIGTSHQFKTPLFNYRRYHTHTTGYLSYGNRSEKIDEIQILEFVSKLI